VPRKPRSELLPPARLVRRLSTVGDILSEQARTYRQAVNGKISWDEASRRTYSLDRMRVSAEVVAASNEIVQYQLPVEVRVLPVQAGTYVSQPQPLQIEPPTETATPEPTESVGVSEVGGERVVAFPVRRSSEPGDPAA